MEIVNVVAAAAGAFAFGAVWYMSVGRAWMDAANIAAGPDGRPIQPAGAMPFIVGFIAMLIVAGMMRHIFAHTLPASISEGFVSGLGIGAFLITPWVAMNYAFAMRNSKLTLIDSVNAIIGCGVMGAILMTF